MKNYVITILLFVLPFVGIGQQFIFEYTNHKVEKSDDYILAINNDISYFTPLNSILDREYVKKARKTGKIDVKNFKKNHSNYYVEKFKNQSFNYKRLLGAKVVLTYNIPELNWNLHNNTKIVNGNKLQKATVQYGGRQWVAWFNPTIPITNGPYVFSGLPGLIEEIQDTEKEHHFIFKGKSSINYDYEFITKENPQEYTNTTTKNFFKVLGEAKENPYEFQITHSAFLALYASDVPNERKVELNRFYKKKLKSFTIEREEFQEN